MNTNSTKKQEEMAYLEAMREVVNLDRIVIETLKNIPLNKVNCRRAYVAGAFTGLIMITLYAELGFPEMDNVNFWPFFLLEKGQGLELWKYIEKVKELSGGVLEMRPSDFVEAGLRHGVTGSYYVDGMSVACLSYISLLLHIRPNRYQKTTVWIDSKYRWLNNLSV